MKRHIGLCLLLMVVSISGVLAGQAGAGRVEICSGARGCIVEAANGAQQGRKLTLRINDSILFAPEFHAYKYGRINNGNGEGKSWFRRFTIMHISDIHSNFSQLEEALLVSADKADVVANTGDDAHGKRAADAPRVREVLGATSATVRRFNRCPYLQVPGNHDVTGVAKQEYFNAISAMVQEFNPGVVWGNREGGRSYGYVDFINGENTGNFRIIMLDPFDYDDSQFENPYKYMSAVFSQRQVDWFMDALVDAAAKGYHVVTMMHYSFGDAEVFNERTANPDALFYQDPFMIPDIIDAVQHRKRLCREYKDLSGVQDIRIDRDFSGAGELDFVAHLFGHIHSKNDYRCRKSDGTEYDILMLGESAIGWPGTALNRIYMEEGTINDISFSALHIDVQEKAIYRVSYGAFRHYDNPSQARSRKIVYRFGL